MGIKPGRWDQEGTSKEVPESQSLGSDHSRHSINAGHWAKGWVCTTFWCSPGDSRAN